MRVLVMVAFGIEALLGVRNLAGFLPRAVGYDATVWAMTTIRALVTLGQVMTVMLLARRAEPAAPLARAVALTSAIVLTLEIGARLAPSNLPPGARGPVLGAYWAYAFVVVVWGSRGNRVS